MPIRPNAFGAATAALALTLGALSSPAHAEERAPSPAPPASADTLPVRPARPAALTGPLVDADVAWILPLLEAQAADARRARAQTGAAVAAGRAAASPEAALARVARIRAGTVAAMDELRAHSPHATVPPSARYHAACSAGLTEGVGGLSVFAAFTGATFEQAEEHYRRAGFEWSGYRGAGFRGTSPDGRIRVSVQAPTDALDVRGMAKRARSGEAPGYGHLVPCADLAGPLLLVQSEGALAAVMRAEGGAAAGGAERLPAALRRAGLSAEQWNTVVTMLWEAGTDEMYAHDPSALDQAAGSQAEGERRRANVRWYVRHRAVVDPAIEATTAGS